MGGWTQQECLICSAKLNKAMHNGRGKIEIGRNVDNRSETVVDCPICSGQGWFKIFRKLWSAPHKRLKF